MATTDIRTIDMGTLNRDQHGRFVKTFTLVYETRDKDTGEIVKVARHLPAARFEHFGKLVSRAGDRGKVWNIQVLDGEDDVTFDFPCFQD